MIITEVTARQRRIGSEESLFVGHETQLEEVHPLPRSISGIGSPYCVCEDTSPWQDNAIRAWEDGEC